MGEHEYIFTFPKTHYFCFKFCLSDTLLSFFKTTHVESCHHLILNPKTPHTLPLLVCTSSVEFRSLVNTGQGPKQLLVPAAKRTPVHFVLSWSSLRLRDVATATKKANLTDKCSNVAPLSGSKGGLVSAVSKRSQDGTSLRTGGWVTNIPLASCLIARLSETCNPSTNPPWTAAMADR